MGGFPNRPDLASFGPDVVNTGIVRDPTRELAAATFNLMRFQVAGLGVVSMLAMLRFTATDPPVQLARAEVWNPKGLTSDPYGDPQIDRVSVGFYVVSYPSPVVDQSGASAALSFTHGFGMSTYPVAVVGEELRFLVHVRVSPFTSNAVRVLIFDGAGAPVDGDGVVIYIG
jgi:hypothetical protein